MIKIKSIVVYESKYGSTERYAKWIGEDLNCKVEKIKDVNIEDLLEYDNIIFGGWLYAGNIRGLKKIKNNIDKFKDKNIVLFCVGLANEDERLHEEVNKSNFKGMEESKYFYLRGAFNYENLASFDKILMRIFKLILNKINKDKMDENARGTLNAFDNPVDFTKKENIKPIIEYINKI